MGWTQAEAQCGDGSFRRIWWCPCNFMDKVELEWHLGVKFIFYQWQLLKVLSIK